MAVVRRDRMIDPQWPNGWVIPEHDPLAGKVLGEIGEVVLNRIEQLENAVVMLLHRVKELESKADAK